MQGTVFTWPSALQEFLDPSNHITPLVELPNSLNPYLDDWVRIFLKLQTFLPLWNIKSISAWWMLNAVKQDLNESKIDTLVENSSGNTAFSLSVLGRAMWIPNMRARVSNEITKEKLQLLQLFWVQTVVNQEQICPNPNDKRSWIYKAKDEWQQPWRYNPDQYHNTANPDIHYKITGKQLQDQISSIDREYNFQIFCAWLGTTGTFIWISKYFKEQKSDFFSLWVVRKPNNPIPWPRTLHLLQQIGFDRKNYVNALQEISSKDAYETSLQLIRAGLVVWPSSGMALCGLFAQLQKMKSEGTLASKKWSHKFLSAVVVCPDGPYPYLDEYFKYCDIKHFPEVINAELLLEKNNSLAGIWNSNQQITCEECFTLLYTPESRKAFSGDSNINTLSLDSNIVLVDLRTQAEFNHVHLSWSMNIPFDEMKMNQFAPYKWKKLILICSYGKKSDYLANKLVKDGFNAFWIMGGMVEWSNKKLPRIVENNCKL